MSTISIISLVFFGGGFGSLSRFGVNKLAWSFYEGRFPLGTVISNFLACLILGITIYIFKEKIIENEWAKYLILIGFCGGFSTFSTFSIETVKLFQDGLILFGTLNILISLSLGFGVLYLLVK